MSLNTILATVPNTTNTYILKANTSSIGNSIMYQDSGGGINVAYQGTTGGARIRISPDSPQGYIESYDASGNPYKLVLATGGLSVRNGLSTVMMEVTSAGKVGIGTSSPSSILNASASTNSGSGSTYPLVTVSNTLATQGDGSSTFNFSGFTTSSGNGAVQMYMSTSYAAGTWEPQGLISVSTNHPMIFRTNNTEKMRLTPGGNLLINRTTTNNPAGTSLLEVGGSQAYNGLVRIINAVNQGDVNHGSLMIVNTASYAVGNDASIGFALTNSGATNYDPRASIGAKTTGNLGARLVFNTRNESTYTEKMTLTQDGNLGINTNAPSARLHNKGSFITESYNYYGEAKSFSFQSAFDNPTVNLMTINNNATYGLTIIRVTIYQNGVAGSIPCNIQVGYAYFNGTGGTKGVSAPAIVVQFNGGVNTGTLSWSGTTLQYTTSRMTNYDGYTIVVDWGANRDNNATPTYGSYLT